MTFFSVTIKQYFSKISLSLEYHMESIFGNSVPNNFPQIRYLQAPAAFKVNHIKKFLSSKYDLNNLKKSMNIDIIYEGDILQDDFSLMDIAYAYFWRRVSIADNTFSRSITFFISFIYHSHRRLL